MVLNCVKLGRRIRRILLIIGDAISEETGALLKVHTSNYRIEGFTSEVPISELSQLAKRYEIPLVTDLGSGLFLIYQN